MGPSVREDWKFFYENTTLHGFRYVFDSSKRSQRVLWFLAVSCALFWVMIEFNQSIRKYFSYPTASITEKVSRSSKPFPSVGLCFRSPLLISKLKASKEMQRLAKQHNKSDLESWEEASIAKLVHLAQRQAIYNKIIRESIPKQTELIKEMKYYGQSVNIAKLRADLSIKDEICYIFNDDKANQQSAKWGERGGLEVTVKLPNSSDLLPSPNSGHSISVIIKEPGEYPDTEQELHIPAGFTAMIGMHRKEMYLIPPPFEKARCLYKPKLKMHSSYSIIGCRQECWEDMTLLLLNCSDILYRRSELFKPCIDVPSSFQSRELKQCQDKCIKDCNSVLYENSVTYQHFISRQYANPKWLRAWNSTLEIHSEDKDVSYDYIKEHYFGLKIYYKTNLVTVVTEVRTYDLFSFLGEIGGELGLFVGASILTLFEFLDFICKVITKGISKKFQKKAVI